MVSIVDNLSEILATSRRPSLRSRRASAFTPAADVSSVRRHVASEAKAADSEFVRLSTGSSDWRMSLEIRKFSAR